MKVCWGRWTLVLALGGCQPAHESLTSTQRAVVHYLKQHAADSTSYESIRWGKERTWRERDWDSLRAITVHQREVGMDSLAHVLLQRLAAATTAQAPADTLRVLRNRYLSAKMQGVEPQTSRQLLRDSTGGMYYRGTSLFHVFRLANTSGTIVRDSAYFTIRENGQLVWSRNKVIFFDEAF